MSLTVAIIDSEGGDNNMDKAGRELLLFNAFISGKKVNKADFVICISSD